MGGRRIAIFSNHPAGPPDVMLAHAEALLKECAKYDHVISMGNHVAWPSSAAYDVVAAALSDSWLQRHPNGVGKPHTLWREKQPETVEFEQGRRTDHIFLSSGIDVVESYYLLPPESETDHPAHWSILRWE